MLRRALDRMAVAALVVVTGASCGGADGSLAIVVGGETDTLTRAPAPVSLVVSSVDLNDQEKELARTSLPASGIDLGSLPKDAIASVRVRGLLPDGTEVVRGGSLYFQWGALEVSRLDVFVQRRGELARMPGEAAAVEQPVTGVVAGRYVFEAKDRALTLFDLLRIGPVTSPSALPRSARSVASFGTSVLLVDEGGATYLDLNDGRSSEVTAPAGGTYAEVAGGVTVTADDGTQLLVGGTRSSGGPTPRILVLSPKGDVTFASLTAAREGACATWVPGRGLVVWGGSDVAPGGELLAIGATVSAPLAYPPDAVRGCAAAAMDAGRIVVAGGTRPAPAAFASSIDLACAGGCAASSWTGSASLARADATLVADDAVLVVGDDESGASHAYRASASGVREIPMRVPRRGAKLVASPSAAASPSARTRAALVVGGATTFEEYID